MRPMAASFSVRMRASSSRRSCRNITHRLLPDRPLTGVRRVRTRTSRAAPRGCATGISWVCGAWSAKVRSEISARVPQAGWAPSANGTARPARPWPRMASAAGLAACTRPSTSITSTPSLSVSITRSLTRACTWAVLRLRCARASSRARRRDSSCASSTTRNRPVLVSAACRKRVGESEGCAASQRQPASASSSRLTAAVVPRPTDTVPSTAPISTGIANSGV